MVLARKKFVLIGLLLGFCAAPTFSQGIFDKQADWGPRGGTKEAGSVAVTGSGLSAIYDLLGNGDDIWNNDDEAFFVYTEKAGDYTLQGLFTWVSPGGNEWAKIGPMIREKGDLATSRNYILAARGRLDLMSPQWRDTEGAGSGSFSERVRDANNVQVPVTDGQVWMRVTRSTKNNLVFSEWSNDGITWFYGHQRTMSFPETVAYGIAITNHDNNTVLANGTAENVQLLPFDKPIAIRAFSQPQILPGKSVDVTLTVMDPAAVTVTETIPTGWTASKISNGGTASGNVIVWNIDATTTQLTYTATASATISSSGFQGSIGDVSVLGSFYLLQLQAGVGLFDGQADIGSVGTGLGSAELVDGEYAVTGSGADIWGTADAMHFLFKEMSGSFSLKGNFWLDVGTGDATWAKSGLMIRDDLTAGSANAFLLVRSAGQRMIAQWRPSAGASSLNFGDAAANEDHAGDMELERVGNTVNYYRINAAGDKILITSQNLPNLKDPVYVGIAVTSHSANNLSTVYTMDAQITEYPFALYRNTLPIDSAPGAPINVSLNLVPRSSTNFTVEETLPANVPAIDIQASAGTATQSDGKLTWTGSNANAAQTLTYTLDVPDSGGRLVLANTHGDGSNFSKNLYTEKVFAYTFNPASIAPFDGHKNVGVGTAAGKVGVAQNNWAVIASGQDIWSVTDGMQFLYKQVSGDFTFSVENAYINSYGATPSTNDWQKMGIMARQSLDPGSAFVINLIRSLDQNNYVQWRETADASAAQNDATMVPGANHTGTFFLERVGDDFSGYYLDAAGNKTLNNTFTVVMTDPIYVGVAVTSHSSGNFSAGTFSNPKLNGELLPVRYWMLH